MTRQGLIKGKGVMWWGLGGKRVLNRAPPPWIGTHDSRVSSFLCCRQVFVKPFGKSHLPLVLLHIEDYNRLLLLFTPLTQVAEVCAVDLKLPTVLIHVG